MNHNMLSAVIATAVLGIAGSMSAVRADDAADNAWTGPKVYLGGGASFAKLDNAEIEDNDVSTGDLSDFDDDHATWQAFAGVMVAPWLGLEAGYLDVPEFEEHGFEVDGQGYSASLVAAAPIGERLELYAKGGRVWWDVEADGPLGFDAEVDGNDWLYGAGANIGLLPNLSLRVEYARYELDSDDAEADLDLATAGLQFNF